MVATQWIKSQVPNVSEKFLQDAKQHQNQLTKPPGSLGLLEDVACRIAAWQESHQPSIERVRIVVFAGDHGVADAGISAFPQSVTTEMVRNFSRGGAAICVLAKHLGANLEVVDVGIASDPGPLAFVVVAKAGPGTANFLVGPAMTADQLEMALNVGREAVLRGKNQQTQLFIGGEMGIGNTTAAAAIGTVLTGLHPEVLAGPGTGLDAQGVVHKVGVIQEALRVNQPQAEDPLDVLKKVGGFEIAALTGFYIAAGQAGIPALVDGFIATCAALLAVRLNPGVKEWLIFAHMSKEPGHAALLNAIDAKPLLSLGMRLGEGSGAAVCVPLLRMACALHCGMATFQEAGVSQAS